MKQFSVARVSVQQAMRSWVQGGVVESRSGAGTVVSGAAIRSNLLNFLRPRRHERQEHGAHRVLRTRVTVAREAPRCEGIFSPTTPVTLLDRVKLRASGKPLVLECEVVNLTMAAPAIIEQDLELLGIIAYYSSTGLQLHREQTRSSAELLSENDAAALEQDPAVPVVCHHRTAYTAPDAAVESAMYLAHPYQLILEVTQNV